MDVDTIVNDLITSYNNNTVDNNFKSKIIDLLKSFKTNLSSNIDEGVTNCLKKLFKLKKSFFVEYGDYILELIWELYNINKISLEHSNSILDVLDEIITKEKQQFYYLTQFCQFDENFVNNLKEISSIENSKLIFKLDDYDGSYSNIYNFIDKFNLKHNQIIDLFILIFMEHMDFQIFYTTLSSFLVQSNSSAILLFKILSLFSYLMVNITNKENYIDSLIFVIGSVLRDHARSYLKSKNLYNESLTYHVCKKKHTKKDHQFFDPIELSSLECDYIEQNFLSVLLGFIISISYNSNYDIKWENYKEIFYKYIDYEDLDVEEKIDKEITINNTLMLFFSDFIFFFISNFSYLEIELGDSIKENSINFFKIKSRFQNFDLLISLSTKIFKLSTNSFFELFNFSALNKRFLNFDCQRTNYQIKDKYNHYGISLLTILNLVYEFKSLNINFDNSCDTDSNETEERNENFDQLFPIISDRIIVIDSLFNSMASVMYFERNKTHTVVSYLKDYNNLINGILKDKNLLIYGINCCKKKLNIDYNDESNIIKNLIFLLKELLLSNKDNTGLKTDNITVFEIIFNYFDDNQKLLIIEKVLLSVLNKKEIKDLSSTLILLKIKLNTITNLDEVCDRIVPYLIEEDTVLLLFKIFDKNLAKEMKEKLINKLSNSFNSLDEDKKIEKDKNETLKILNKIMF